MTTESLQAKLKEYQDAAQTCRANAQNQTSLAIANDGAAQAIQRLISEMEMEKPVEPTPEASPAPEIPAS